MTREDLVEFRRIVDAEIDRARVDRVLGADPARP
jgi:hypothetical protein